MEFISHLSKGRSPHMFSRNKLVNVLPIFKTFVGDLVDKIRDIKDRYPFITSIREIVEYLIEIKLFLFKIKYEYANRSVSPL